MMSRSLVLLALAATAHAQVYTPPAAAPPLALPPASDSAPAAADPPADPRLLGEEIPLLDPAAETITVGGVAIPLGDNRLLKARFEKFLNQAPESSDAAAAYRATVADILATISPLRRGGPDLSAAFTLLPTASAYPGDANLCGSLAESIYMALLAKHDVKGLERLNTTLETEKKSIIQEGDWNARHERETAGVAGAAPGGGEGGGTPPRASQPSSLGAGARSLHYADVLRRITEIEALKKANIARTEAQTLKTKAQYQVSMVQWFMQRRYEHVLMAARFYNQIWKDGDSTLRVNKDSDVAKLFSESVGVSPTVSSLDALANEAIREVEKYVEAFDLLLERGELHSASQRLMEAYALGEYLAPVATMPLSKKRRVQEYVRDLHELYGTLQARDYAKTRELADRLKKSARDFPSSKVDSAVAGFTLASDLAIEEAKTHLLVRDTKQAGEKIQAAAAIWPSNPKLEEFRRMLAAASPLLTTRNDFDRLLAEGNFREIFRRQYEIAPAIQDDETRRAAFQQIIENLAHIEGALQKAAEFGNMGQHDAAWEQLAALRERFPDDPKLGRALELLAPKVADFTHALDRARQFEQRTPKQIGSALSWYLKARSIHPQSLIAKQAVDRLAEEILPTEVAAGTAAEGGAPE
jgi:hypothetical protein